MQDCQSDENRWLDTNNCNIGKATVTNLSLISVKREEDLTKNEMEIVDCENSCVLTTELHSNSIPISIIMLFRFLESALGC